MESILEQQRKAHEEIERLEQAIVEQFINEPKTVRHSFLAYFFYHK